MVLALLNRFDPRILDVIIEHVSQRPVIGWKRLYGYTLMYKTRHFVTDSHPCGGYVYFHRERGKPVGTYGTWIIYMMSLSTLG